ncbi:MAG: DUF1638 domain-containing protein [Phycisphaerae bacterium]|nr:DUF1638 domain-containing protein [Phycisphaerae bacterium]
MKTTSPQRRFKFIGCEIVYREACHLAASTPHQVDVEFLRKGLHDLERADMVAKIQATIDAVGASQYEAILLGYARCNDGVAGVRARQLPLILPRAHDCITLFFGSRAKYQAYFDEHPGTYYLTTGWAERNLYGTGDYAQPAYGKTGVMGKLGLAGTYEEMVAQYGKENADFILESLGDWRANYSNCLYLSMGVCDETTFVEQARAEAAKHNWRFEERPGDMTLLKKLFWAKWDEDFLIVPPGAAITARNDRDVVGVEE